MERVKVNRMASCSGGSCPQERRSCYLINKRLQITSAMIAGIATLLISTLFSILLWKTYYYFSLFAGLSIAENYLPMRGIPLVSQLQNYLAGASAARFIASKEAGTVLLVALACSIVYAIGVGYLELLRTHRIAGPAHKLCKYLQLAKEGKYSIRIAIRKNDALQETVDAFNELMETLEKRKETVPAEKK